jgi:hypothetical protein
LAIEKIKEKVVAIKYVYFSIREDVNKSLDDFIEKLQGLSQRCKAEGVFDATFNIDGIEWSCEVSGYREETEAEKKDREANEQALKEMRYKQYLMLKKEFEGK